MANSRQRQLISLREYGRRRGVSHMAVQRAVNSGRITTVHGKIDPDLADRQWEENTDQSKPRNRITGHPKLVRVPGQPSEPMDLGGEPGNGAGTSYARARAAREIAQARLAQLELEQKRGTLVEANQVRVAAFNAARKTRDQLIALPERMAAVLAATTDAGEVLRILELEVERICEELSE